MAGVPKERIFRLGEKDNFWQMGETGPCGPCSEIHYDFGPEAGAGSFPDDPGERFVAEIWNLVFMQYGSRDAQGTLNPLPRPSIDTGMGLERIAAVKQGVLSNYDTDLIKPIVLRAGELIGCAFGEQAATDTVLRINADHARATAFLIHDGGGAVERGARVRAAQNHAPGDAKWADGGGYRSVPIQAHRVRRGAYAGCLSGNDGEHRARGSGREGRGASLRHHLPSCREDFPGRGQGCCGGVLPGPTAFKLYDTYGLALDEQEEMARETGLTIDREGFTAEMEKQRTRARASWKGAEKAQVRAEYQALPKTEFVGRETLEAPATVVAAFDGEVALDRTPFYAEAGGQVGDSGVLISAATGDTVAVVESAYNGAPGKTIHKVKVIGPVQVGDEVIAKVDASARESTMRNHTGTHLLHAALRRVLGSHVKQAGSVVEPSRLRFDFTHYTAMDRDEVTEVERLMNQEILANRLVHTDVMDLDQALSTGAMALFGEKYGEHVRVVSIDSFSKELCGGTHVVRTGDIGLCKIVYEGSISAGVRRIEAITGEEALRRFQSAQAQLAGVAECRARFEGEMLEQLEKLVAKEKLLEHEVQQLKIKMAQAQAGDLESQAREIKGVKVLAARVDGFDRQQLRTLVDSLRNKWKSAVVVLAAAHDSDIAIVSGVTKDLTSKVQAGKLVQEIALGTGGKGGGRPDMAEGGGKNVAALAAELDRVYQTVEERL